MTKQSINQQTKNKKVLFGEVSMRVVHMERSLPERASCWYKKDDLRMLLKYEIVQNQRTKSSNQQQQQQQQRGSSWRGRVISVIPNITRQFTST
jgi:hypothetical protein